MFWALNYDVFIDSMIIQNAVKKMDGMKCCIICCISLSFLVHFQMFLIVDIFCVVGLRSILIFHSTDTLQNAFKIMGVFIVPSYRHN